MAGWSAKSRAVCGTLIALAIILASVSVCRAITAEAVDGIVKPMMDKAKIPGKTGGISGFNAYFAYLPEKDLIIAATANLENSLGDLIRISLAISQL